MAVLEALMAGVPCLLSAIPPHREIMQQVFGDETLIFDETQRGALAELFDRVGAKIQPQSDKREGQGSLQRQGDGAWL